MKTKSMNVIVTVLVSLLALTACGGGGGGGGVGVGVVKTPNIAASQATVDFGSVVLKNSAEQTIVVQNNGNGDLAIGNIGQLTPPFSISSETCSNTTLNPTEKCYVYVKFLPTIQNSYNGIISIPSNDPDMSSVNISMKGNGNALNTWINQVNAAGPCPGPVITVDATVDDPTGTRDLTALTPANFTLSENGIAIDPSKITLSNLQTTPVSVVLALDWSESVTQITSAIGTAAKYFIDQLNPTDEAAIWKYNNRIDYYPQSSPYFIAGDASGKAELKTFIDTALVVDPGTKLFDSVYQSIDRAALGSKSKRAVIILSDGVEAPGTIPSTKTVEDVIANAKLKGIPVFTIYYVDPTFNGGNWGNPQILERLAKETGGQYYNSVSADLITVFKQIANVLSNKYTFTYKSTSSCNESLTLGVSVNYNSLLGETSKTVTLP